MKFLAASAACTALLVLGCHRQVQPEEGGGLSRTAREQPGITEEAAYPDDLRLQKARDFLEGIRRAGGWPVLPASLRLRPGMRDAEYVPRLRTRLHAEQDLRDLSVSETDLFDPALESALRNFQIRHSLEADGVLGRETVRELNISVSERIRQIEVNLERRRELPRDLGKNYIIVNLADYRLTVVSGQQALSSMKVIVGQKGRPTPTFTGKITGIEINPKWHVPEKIAELDLLPILCSDPAALVQKGFHFYSLKDGTEVDPARIDWSGAVAGKIPYRIIQDSGPLNALGRIKFWIPNPYAIFLHDTPAPELFEKRVRAFSSGCIRVEKPYDLADFLLQNSAEWTSADFRKEISSGANRIIPVEPPLPIYIVYWTAWADEDGTVHFRPDIYDRNRQRKKKIHPEVAPK